MSTIVTRAGKGAALTHVEADANFTNLNTDKLETTDIGVSVQAYSANLSEYAAVNPTAAGLALLDDADASAQRTTLGLGTAATTASSDYAVAAKGVTNGDGHDHSGGDGAQIAYSSLSGTPSVREKLTASRTYYIRTDGSDSNNGLTDTSGGAFLTLQKAIDTAVGLDLSVYTVTLKLADGTYTGANTLKSYVGGGPIYITGNTTTPANVVISVTGSCFSGENCDYWYIQGVKLVGSTGRGLFLFGNKTLVKISSVDFGACTYQHMSINDGAILRNAGNWTISGASGSSHIDCSTGGMCIVASATCTITGTPALTTFAAASLSSVAIIQSVTFSGSATGTRYSATMNGVIQTYGGGATYLPGNVAGSTATGGQYA